MILTLLATLGSAIAASATTVATTVAAGVAAVGSTVATVGAAKVVGGVTVAALAKGAAAVTAGGVALAAVDDAGYQRGRTDGEKKGYEKASKEYKEKFQSLCAQLNKANITITEQRQYIAKLRELNTDMRSALEYYKAQGENVSSLRNTYDTSTLILNRLAA